jgi:hypothetical protein
MDLMDKEVEDLQFLLREQIYKLNFSPDRREYLWR